MKKNLQRLGLIIVGVLFILAGLQTVISGEIGSMNGMKGTYEFYGLERLLGVVVAGFGGLVVYLVVTKRTALDDDEEEE